MDSTTKNLVPRQKGMLIVLLHANTFMVSFNCIHLAAMPRGIIMLYI